MCVIVTSRTMGCGKSRHRSPDDSEIDLKTSSNNATNITKNSNSRNAFSQNAKKKKTPGSDQKNMEKEEEKEVSERSSSVKKMSNGKSSKLKERNDDIGVPLSTSPKKKSEGAAAGAAGGDKSNGATKSQNKSFLLEVPNEISKTDTQSKTTCRDFKSLTASKTVHVTSSQIEFFKMLDEKIEKGDDYLTSGDNSEVSSVDDGLGIRH